ncbi:hypothetical protein SDC9_173156 [bioreactor metagenome]|uniref:Uncharacterized protein n=1 Tax=bioreactor metagenome TaxID=1076179 RepID=A0A645GFN6_9ZZZZ
MGFKQVFVAKDSTKNKKMGKIQVVECKYLAQVIAMVFQR